MYIDSLLFQCTGNHNPNAPFLENQCAASVSRWSIMFYKIATPSLALSDLSCGLCYNRSNGNNKSKQENNFDR